MAMKTNKLDPQVVDTLIKDCKKPEDILGKDQCIVHMIRNSLRYVGWKLRKEVAAGLKMIYSAKMVDEAEAELAVANFAEKWDKQFPSISKLANALGNYYSLF